MCPALGSGGRLASMDVFKGMAISFIAVLHIAIVARAGMSEPSPFLQALYLGLVGFFVSRIPYVSVLFRRIGEHTMGILLLHVFIAKIALAPFFTFNTVDCITGDFQAGIGRTLFSIAVLLAAYLICYMIGRARKRDERVYEVRP